MAPTVAVGPPPAPVRTCAGSGPGAAAVRAAGALRVAGAGGRRGALRRGLLAAAEAARSGTGGAVAGGLLGVVHDGFPWLASMTGCLRWPHCRRGSATRTGVCDQRSAPVRQRSRQATERLRRRHATVPAAGKVTGSGIATRAADRGRALGWPVHRTCCNLPWHRSGDAEDRHQQAGRSASSASPVALYRPWRRRRPAVAAASSASAHKATVPGSGTAGGGLADAFSSRNWKFVRPTSPT